MGMGTAAAREHAEQARAMLGRVSSIQTSHFVSIRQALDVQKNDLAALEGLCRVEPSALPLEGAM